MCNSNDLEDSVEQVKDTDLDEDLDITSGFNDEFKGAFIWSQDFLSKNKTQN